MGHRDGYLIGVLVARTCIRADAKTGRGSTAVAISFLLRLSTSPPTASANPPMEHEPNQEPTVRMQARLSRSPGGFSAAPVGSRDESKEEDEGPNVEDLRTIPTGARLEVSAAVKEGAVAVPLHIRECGYPFHVRTDTNWHAVQTPPDTKSARTLCEPPHEGCVLDATPY